MNRRRFLRASASGVGAVALGSLLAACGGDDRDRDAERALAAPRLLDGRPSDAPIDTVVIVMLENRSFDHYVGWLGRDARYLDTGRSRYGRSFTVDGRQLVRYRAADGKEVTTNYLLDAADEPNPYRGCDRRIPGHSWDAGRAERDHGFAAAGTNNDSYALGYYEGRDVALHEKLARRFTVADNSFSSLLAGTFPNRQYMHAATSLGLKRNPHELDIGIFRGDTIWDRLAAANVPARYYYVDLAFLSLWGERTFAQMSVIDDFFDDAAKGTLPNVVMVDPGFAGPDRSDNHPHGDIRMAMRYLQSVFSAAARSPQWNRMLFVLTYDEWGGFFDHVAPPVVPDDRASKVDDANFGQTGFRVPTMLASPYVRRGFVDHRQYDHTSILRFIEWRFLGAPADGTRAPNGRWYLTTRDRHAHNIGSALVTNADPDLDFDLDTPLPGPSGACGGPEIAHASTDDLGPGDIPHTDQFKAVAARRLPVATERPWL